MVCGLIQRSPIAVPGLIALSLLLLWASPACPALLKDIRFGEHETFTRIVLEFDGSAGAAPLLLEEFKRITLIYTDIHPELARKIPVERAGGIEELKIHTDGDQLRISFHFTHEIENLKTSTLDNPWRLVIDFSIVPSPPPAPEPQAAMADITHPPDFSGAVLEVEPVSLRLEDEDAPQSDIQPNPENEQPAQDAAGPGHPMPSHAIAYDTPVNAESARAASSDRSTPKTSGSLYYMAIALVVITVGSLTLLLVMMLHPRNALSLRQSRRPHLNTNEYLETQGNRPTVLNARIKEQLEMYEKE
jgi:hypothetical protein